MYLEGPRCAKRSIRRPIRTKKQSHFDHRTAGTNANQNNGAHTISNFKSEFELDFLGFQNIEVKELNSQENKISWELKFLTL